MDAETLSSIGPDGGRGAGGRVGSLAVLALAISFLLPACAVRTGPTAPPPESSEGPVEPGWTQVGVSSWYGPNFHGRPTASGETFDMEAMTAAHQTLPLGTRIRVTVLETGRRATLRVNDRGPFKKNRILDVSRAGARVLGFLSDGTARVRITVLESGGGCFEVQVGSYSSRDNAREARRRLERSGEPTRTEPGPGGLIRVVAGPYDDDASARRVRQRHGGFIREC